MSKSTNCTNGTPEQWRERVAALCAGNSRLVFAVSAAFAGPLLRPGGVVSGGFHFWGDSSSGKTTALKVAASVYGDPGHLRSWRATDNELEHAASQCENGFLILDEMTDPKTAGECAYMLVNEQGKARATRSGMPRARLSWRLLFLSAGELGLVDHMAARVADIPADAGAGMGAFEFLHGREGGADFARHLTGQAGSVYGTAGRAWLQWLAEQPDTLKTHIRAAAGRLAGRIVPEAAGGQVERMATRFALVGAAGELATEAGLTGWARGEAERAARDCFNAWLLARGSGCGTSGPAIASMPCLPRSPVLQRIEVLEAERRASWKTFIYLDSGAEEAVMRLYDLAAGPGDEDQAAIALADLEAKREGAYAALGRFTEATREALCLLDGGALDGRKNC